MANARLTKNKIIRLSLYILGSVLFLLIPVFTSPDFNRGFSFIHISPFQREWLNYLFLLVFFYLHHFWFLPRYYFKKKYTAYIGSIVLSFAACTLLPQLFIQYPEPIGPPHHGGPMGRPDRVLPIQNIFRFLVVCLAAFIIELNRHLKQSEKARTEAEMTLLKAQINPHFLFNTLNSIYALALSKSDKTAGAVAQLSQLMRYAMNDASNEWIQVSKEIRYLEGYIQLQQMRLADNNHIELQIDEGVSSDRLIGSMLLIPFIENAFKYGTNPDEESTIKIAIAGTTDRFHMHCFNTKVKSVINEAISHKLGLVNVEQRLNNLYGSSYELIIENTEQTFNVNLSLPLK